MKRRRLLGVLGGAAAGGMAGGTGAYGRTADAATAPPVMRVNHDVAARHHLDEKAMLRVVGGLLGRGFSVLVCAMPFMHWNAQPITDPADPAKRTTLTGHDGLARWESLAFSAVRRRMDHRSYAAAVAQRARLAGDGHWELVEDATHDRHTVSPYALSVIPHDLAHA